jgi:hypothetical protein
MDTPINKLPKGLIVNGYLNINSGSSLANFSNDELREMVKPGYIKGIIKM